MTKMIPAFYYRAFVDFAPISLSYFMEVSLLHATRPVYFLVIRNQNTKQARIDSAIYTEEASGL